VSAELPETRFVPGAGIVATGGRVRVVQGLVSGGNALLVSENAVQRVVTLAPALEARAGSTVEILGGTLTSSGAFLASGVTGTSTRFDSAELLPEVVSVADSVVRVEGGTLRGGPRERAVTTTLGATRSTVEITGGDFDDEGALISFVLLRGSRSTIRGGRFDTLVLVPAGPRMPMSPVDPLVPGCTEIRGGSFDDLNVVGNGERVIVFGTDFNRPLGPLPTGPDTMTPVSGILEAGNAVAFDANLAGGTLVSLAAPGSPGCP
jgi:hypothetical protein